MILTLDRIFKGLLSRTVVTQTGKISPLYKSSQSTSSDSHLQALLRLMFLCSCRALVLVSCEVCREVIEANPLLSCLYPFQLWKSDSLALKDTSSIISSSVCPEPLTISQNSTNSSNWMCPSLLKSTVSKNTLADIAPNLVLFQCFYASLRSIVLLPSLSKMLKTSVTAFVSSGLKSYQIISQ